jgi:arsenite methyltransferase
VHPLAFAARGDNAGFAQVGEMARDFRLALAQDLDKVADADFAAGHEVEQAKAGGVCQGGKKAGQRDGFGGASHAIYCIRIDKYECDEYICLSECEKRSMDTKTLVQEKYGAEARQVRESGTVACCDPGLSCCDPITTNLYDEAQKSWLPASAVLASLGCGNPTALIELKPGETVLDLGSGGGIDVLLSARRVGSTGKAYGLDMTDDMLALARANQREAGVENAEFLKGEIESIPLPDESVDVVISNCVINLSADKGRVLREAFRVLRPGGRFAVSDVVVRGEVDELVRKSMLLWVGCIAGALEERDYGAKLVQAGFSRISIEPTREYSIDDARHFLVEAGIDVDAIAPLVEGKFMSAFIRATKPGGACCAPGCCG